LYDAAEAAIVRYAQRSTREVVVDDETFADLAGHFAPRQLIDICLTVGLSNMVNRFHATFHTDLDEETLAAVEAGDAAARACALPRPAPPGRASGGHGPAAGA